MLLKVSSQGQLTLRRTLLRSLGDPTHMRVAVAEGGLLLTPAAPLEDAAALLEREGVTRAVLVEALRIVAIRRSRGSSS